MPIKFLVSGGGLRVFWKGVEVPISFLSGSTKLSPTTAREQNRALVPKSTVDTQILENAGKSERFRGLSGIFPKLLPESPSRTVGVAQLLSETPTLKATS